ncbi:HAD family hydrolase [Caldisericum exile]|uniref:phosphoglycolate phosphatase n=1 Tax=Caldisericum exile (strain DSM 21853 / NBRC 104410 / AZM16c01) TaxID=511051 RepID=A0A7U6JG47_CALEA|nr:HAD family hydrolase [Caldisericum exile]BAL81005.1 putative hydrolase [Caldisericum exile AZM16c01]
MKNKINLLIFDFDGTLFDTSLDIANAINHVRRKLGMEILDKEVIWNYTGDGLLNTVIRSFPELKDEETSTVYLNVLKYYEEHSGEFSKPIDDVLAFIEKDTHRKIILSNKNLKPMLKVLERFNIKEKFEKIYGFDSLPYFKPDPGTVSIILQETGTKRDEVALIGDADQDVLTAKNAKIKCYIIPSKKITVDYPYTKFSNYFELEKLLEKN